LSWSYGASREGWDQSNQQRVEAPRMEINIGTNVFRNSNGVLKVLGKEQIVLQFLPEENRLLLTMDIYDDRGEHIAHVRRSTWAFNENNRFELTGNQGSLALFSSPSWLKLTDKESGDIVLEASVNDKGHVQIIQGKFYSFKGELIEVTPHCLRLPGKPTKFGDVVDVRGREAVVE
jgi:hypothetical protein